MNTVDSANAAHAETSTEEGHQSVISKYAANPAAILALIQQRDELLAALKHIREYWNGDQNDEAMADACFAAISISEEAVAKAEAQS